MRGRIVDSMEGWKENPHRPTGIDRWGAQRNESNMMGSIMKTSLVHSCKPDANKKKAPTDEPTRKPVRAKRWVWVRYVLPQNTLPTQHLTIECRMNEQKKTPTDTSLTEADGGVGQVGEHHAHHTD